jgi:diaminohydroxyphosphoribosylaminopyrimidine deaminase / 5-amino-6-(5-phosphoribosylamino)uracil reductase
MLMPEFMSELPSEFSSADAAFMQRALDLAQGALYISMPNPRVGCVLVKAGQIIGEGFTQPAGFDHAEVQALKDCVARGHDARGATAYVTLEPCSHFGRTPPCADGLVRAGVARVVAAMLDPNPLVAGNGFKRLQAAGIAVAAGLLEAQAQELNVGFISRMVRGRPWLRLKIAASLDGKTALANGQSQWITSPEARADVQHWRARSCAMLTGSGTVLADDPQLTVRALNGVAWEQVCEQAQQPVRQPWRIILDSRLQTPLNSKILQTLGVLIVHAGDVQSGEVQPRVAALQAAGAECIALPGADGHIDLAALLPELGRRQMNEVTVEAGARLNGALLQAGVVDEIVLYQAPVLLGDDARGMAQFKLTDLSQKRVLTVLDQRQIGPDLRWVLR